MNFIIKRFLMILRRDYGITTEVSHNNNGSCSLLFLNLNQELKKRILELTFNKVIGHKQFKNREDEVIRVEPIVDSYKLASEVRFKDNTNGVCINMDDDTYAEKIVNIDFCIKRYFEDHSPIDAINGKH